MTANGHIPHPHANRSSSSRTHFSWFHFGGISTLALNT
jgi:hypothetical protein